jgi:hypothetical protein
LEREAFKGWGENKRGSRVMMPLDFYVCPIFFLSESSVGPLKIPEFVIKKYLGINPSWK